MTLYGTVPSYSFTSREEIERLLSLTGNQQWLDDLGDIDVTDFYSEIVADATLTCLQYLGRVYDANDLASSYWVRRRATYIAAYHLTKRRGDPGLYGEDYQRSVEELQDVWEGLIQIPEIPFSSGMAAVMQNITVDQRYVSQKGRVVQHLSTDVSGRENLLYIYPYSWL